MNLTLKKHIEPSASLLAIVAILAYLVTTPSCANQGVGPEGGPKDSIAPRIVAVVPENKQVNYNGNQIEVTFNEFVTLDNANQKLVVSPPLAEKPTIKTKGKTVSVKINEDLIPGRTYSIDFQNSIKDFNEGNVLESLRLLFSTYEKIDTLRISGYLLDAFTLEPVENAIATLYSLDNDTVFKTLRPDYIARTNNEGFFMFDNLAEGNYRLFGLVDGDNNLKYSSELEMIAFTDTLLSPKTLFIEKIDTLFKDKDTIVSKGYFDYIPKEVSPRLFLAESFNQFIASSKREKPDFLQFAFSESITDSFEIEILNLDSALAKNFYLEFSPKRDTVSVWLTDSLLANNDSLFVCLHYNALDSMQSITNKADTLKMFYLKQTLAKGKANKNNEKPIIQTLQIQTNAAFGLFDYFLPLYVETPSPTTPLKKENVHLFEVQDSIETEVVFNLTNTKTSARKYLIDTQLKENTKYIIRVDSASVHSYTQIPNAPFELEFKTQKAEFYGSFVIEMSSFPSATIVQLLSNSKKEEIAHEFFIPASTTNTKLEYLKPGKYKVKLIEDRNGNLKWDTGDYKTHTQPERVFYLPKVVEIRSNWELKENWNIDLNAPQRKEIPTDKKK